MEHNASNEGPTLGDLGSAIRQFAAPVLASLDAKLKEQIEAAITVALSEVVLPRIEALEHEVDELRRQLGDDATA